MKLTRGESRGKSKEKRPSATAKFAAAAAAFTSLLVVSPEHIYTVGAPIPSAFTMLGD